MRTGAPAASAAGSSARPTRLPPRADVAQPHSLARDGGKRAGRAQKLPAAFAVGTVYFAHSAVIITRVRFHHQREQGFTAINPGSFNSLFQRNGWARPRHAFIL